MGRVFQKWKSYTLFNHTLLFTTVYHVPALSSHPYSMFFTLQLVFLLTRSYIDKNKISQYVLNNRSASLCLSNWIDSLFLPQANTFLSLSSEWELMWMFAETKPVPGLSAFFCHSSKPTSFQSFFLHLFCQAHAFSPLSEFISHHLAHRHSCPLIS